MMVRLIAILLAGALAGLLWLQQENSRLRLSLERGDRLTGEQKQTISALNNQLSIAVNSAAENEQAQIALRENLYAVSEREAQREDEIKELLHANEAFRHWYYSDLPDDVRRLYRRDPCDSAGDCLPQLPESDALSDAGKRSTH